MLHGGPKTTYRLLQALDNLADLNLNLKTLKISICENGCEAFYKDNANTTLCNHCDAKRWKHCNQQCNDENGLKM